jgi:exodeoxyribonuclease VII large subunit
MESDIKTDLNENIIFSVSEVTLHLRQVIETQLEALYITGEVSNFVRHSSGHLYFNLKDDNAVMRCAFFRNYNYALDFSPADGDQVVCFGKISVFEKSGSYQLLVQNMFPYGKGMLQQKFEQLKQKLKEEGLFDSTHKKQLPKYPSSIGIITSPTGAALQDILNVMGRRMPVNVIVYPALMQGESSAGQVTEGIAYFNAAKLVDLIIITRGGGSQEDLFGFNDENLARTIFASELPVISAIGHEIDFTIADFVADLRAPTPSAAAELAVPDRQDVLASLDKVQNMLKTNQAKHLAIIHNSLNRHRIKIMQNNPERVWQSIQQRFDNAFMKISGLGDRLARIGSEYDFKLASHSQGFKAVSANVIQAVNHKLDLFGIKASYTLKETISDCIHRLDLSEAGLKELSPLGTLQRGYTLIRKNGRIVRSASSLVNDDKLELMMSDGSAQVTVESVDIKEPQ